MSKKFYELGANDEVTIPADIAALPASAITSGTFDAARIPNIAAGKITSGILVTARIPSLDASKIASGTLGSARLPLANGSSKGAVNPIAKTSAMTQDVGIDTSTGKLYTAAGGGGGGSSNFKGYIISFGPLENVGTLTMLYADGSEEIITGSGIYYGAIGLKYSGPFYPFSLITTGASSAPGATVRGIRYQPTTLTGPYHMESIIGEGELVYFTHNSYFYGLDFDD